MKIIKYNIDKIESTNENNNYSSFIKTFCAGSIKKACYEIINEAIYANSTNSTCNDSIKSTNYIDSIKSTCNDTLRNKFTYADSAKRTCKDTIKSTIANINYLDISKSTCVDNVKRARLILLSKKGFIVKTLIIKVYIVKSTMNVVHY